MSCSSCHQQHRDRDTPRASSSRQMRGQPSPPQVLGIDDFDVDQQSLVAEMATLHSAGTAHEGVVVAGHADVQHPALHRDMPHAPVALDEGVRCLWALTQLNSV